MVVEFLFDVEDEFNIEVPDDRAEFETLNEAATLIDELIEAKGDCHGPWRGAFLSRDSA